MRKLFVTFFFCSTNLFSMEPPTGSSSGSSQEVSELSIPLPSLKACAAITYLKHSDARVAETLQFFQANEAFADNPERLPDNLQQYLDRIRTVFHREPFTLSPEQIEKKRPCGAENPCYLPMTALNEVGWCIDDPRNDALAHDCPDIFHYMTHHQKLRRNRPLLKACVMSGALTITRNLFQQSPPTPERATKLLQDIVRASYHPFYLFDTVTPDIYIKLLEQHKRRLVIAKILVETYHANLEATNDEGNTLLYSSIDLSSGLEATDPRTGYDYLVPTNGDGDLTELLLKHGANVNAQNNYGNTPLHNAAWLERIPLVKLLLRYHPNTTLRENDHGWTALDIVSRKNCGDFYFQDAQGNWHKIYDEIKRLIERYNYDEDIAYEGIAPLFYESLSQQGH